MKNEGDVDALIRKLKREIGIDIVLFDSYGLSYFGNLQEIDDSIALLGPAALSSSGLVEILTPSEVIAGEYMVRIDLRFVVGQGTAIYADPFVFPADADGEGDARFPRVVPVRQASMGDCEGEKYNQLASHLTRQSGNLVSLGIRGGFLFAGQLAEVGDGIANLSVNTIFAPGGDGSTLFGISSADVRLDALVSVSS